MINKVLEIEDELYQNLVTFQEDGAINHFYRIGLAYLDWHFPRLWIGRREAIEWPAWSPLGTPWIKGLCN